MKNVKLIFAVLLLVVVNWISLEASVRVESISLKKTSQFTEFTIGCDNQFEYEHQIVEASDDKPFRIVVDIKDAWHRLPQYSFSDIPKGSITQIRSSQYTIDPQGVVRLVLDVTGTLTYKIQKKDNKLTIYVNTPNDKHFALWMVKGEQESSAEFAVVTDNKPTVMPAHPDSPSAKPNVDLNDPSKKGLQLSVKPKIDQNKVTKENLSSKEKVIKPPEKIELTDADLKLFAEVFVGVEDQQTEVVTPVKSKKDVAQEKFAAKETPTALPEKIELTDADRKLFAEVFVGVEEQKNEKETPATTKQLKQKQVDVKEKVAGTDKKTKVSTPPQQQTTVKKDVKYIDTSSQPVQEFLPTSPLIKEKNSSKDIKTPKHKKTTLPEIKVNKKPKLADADLFEDESLNNESAKELSTVEAIRNKYRKAPATKSQTQTQAAMDFDDENKTDNRSNIERIRSKYKRGIKFVQDEADEHRLALEADIKRETSSQHTPELIGAYSEYIPAREIVTYSSNGRRDPFGPLVEESITGAERGDLPDVEMLRLVGILQDQNQSRALFEDFNGYAFILQTGDRVKNGFVVSITDERVTFQIRQYGWNRKVALHLDEEI